MKKEAWGQKGTSFHDFMLLRYEFAEVMLGMMGGNDL